MGKWDMVRLGDVCDGVSSNIAQKDLESNEGSYPIYGASGLIKCVDFYKHATEYIAVVKDGAGIGRTTLHPPKSSVIGTMQAIVPRASVNSRYLYYVVSAMNLAKYYTGATIPHIYFKDYKKEILPLPPLPVQQQIADVLDRSSTLIEKRKAQIEKLDLLVKSQFIEMFGDPVQNAKEWPLTTVGKVAEIKIGPFGTLLHKEDYIENGHALVNPSHIVNGKICIDPKLTIADKKYEELSAYKLQLGDVVLGRRGEMGRCAVVYEVGLLCGTGSMIIRPGQFIRPYFLQNILSSPAYKKIIEEKAVGVTMMNLNVPIVSELQIPLLPIKLQKEFIAFMEQVDKSKFVLQQSLKKLELNYKSLMQKCFRSEIF